MRHMFLHDFVVSVMIWKSGSVWSSIVYVWSPVFLYNHLQSQQVYDAKSFKICSDNSHVVYFSLYSMLVCLQMFVCVNAFW